MIPAVGNAALFSASLGAYEYGRTRPADEGRPWMVYGKVGMTIGALGVAAPWVAAGAAGLVGTAAAISPWAGIGAEAALLGVGISVAGQAGLSMYNDWGRMSWIDWVDRHGADAALMGVAAAYGGYRLTRWTFGKSGPWRDLRAWQLRRTRPVTVYRFATETSPRTMMSQLSQAPWYRRLIVRLAMQSRRMRLARAHAHMRGDTLESPFVSVVKDPERLAASTDAWARTIVTGAPGSPGAAQAPSLARLRVPRNLLIGPRPENALSIKETEMVFYGKDLAPYVVEWTPNPF